MKKTISIAVVLYISLLFIGNSLATEIAWMNVQHREYANGKDVNRLNFGLVDQELNYVTSRTAVKDIQLIDPMGKPVKLSPVEFGSVDEIYGNYDAKNSQWYFDKTWQFDSWFKANIEAPLVAGSYILTVTSAEGKKTERAYTFNQEVDLPIIDSDSIKLRPDSSGNMIWTWRIPEKLGSLSLNHPMRARASIDIFNDNKYAGYFSIIIPVHLGFVLIPNDVVKKINQKGNRFEVMISLETRDKNNRTYSKPVGFNQMLLPS
jgi:hypothetical protein